MKIEKEAKTLAEAVEKDIQAVVNPATAGAMESTEKNKKIADDVKEERAEEVKELVKEEQPDSHQDTPTEIKSDLKKLHLAESFEELDEDVEENKLEESAASDIVKEIKSRYPDVRIRQKARYGGDGSKPYHLTTLYFSNYPGEGATGFGNDPRTAKRDNWRKFLNYLYKKHTNADPEFGASHDVLTIVEDPIKSESYFEPLNETYNKYANETDVEFLKDAIHEMKRYVRNWEFMGRKEKQNIAPDGLAGLKQELKFAENRLKELGKDESLDEDTTGEEATKTVDFNIYEEARFQLTKDSRTKYDGRIEFFDQALGSRYPIDMGVNWSAIGTVSPDIAEDFADKLKEAANTARNFKYNGYKITYGKDESHEEIKESNGNWYSVHYEVADSEGNTERDISQVCANSSEEAEAQVKKSNPNAKIIASLVQEDERLTEAVEESTFSKLYRDLVQIPYVDRFVRTKFPKDEKQVDLTIILDDYIDVDAVYDVLDQYADKIIVDEDDEEIHIHIDMSDEERNTDIPNDLFDEIMTQLTAGGRLIPGKGKGYVSDYGAGYDEVTQVANAEGDKGITLRILPGHEADRKGHQASFEPAKAIADKYKDLGVYYTERSEIEKISPHRVVKVLTIWIPEGAEAVGRDTRLAKAKKGDKLDKVDEAVADKEFKIEDCTFFDEAADAFNKIEVAGKIGEFLDLVNDLYGGDLSESKLNDLLTYEKDWVFDALRIEE